MPEVSGFTADLYCDHPAHGYRFVGASDGEYIHPTLRAPAIAEARRDGWVFKRNGDVICPKCAKIKEQPK